MTDPTLQTKMIYNKRFAVDDLLVEGMQLSPEAFKLMKGGVDKGSYNTAAGNSYLARLMRMMVTSVLIRNGHAEQDDNTYSIEFVLVDKTIWLVIDIPPKVATGISAGVVDYIIAKFVADILTHRGIQRDMLREAKSYNQDLVDLAFLLMQNDLLHVAGISIPDHMPRGYQVIGVDCGERPFNDVYDRLKQLQEDDPDSLEDIMDQAGIGSLETNLEPGEFGNYLLPTADDLKPDSEIQQAVSDSFDSFLDAGGQQEEKENPVEFNKGFVDDFLRAAGAGSDTGHIPMQFIRKARLPAAWKKFMRYVNPDYNWGKGIVVNSTFRKASRKLIGGDTYPKIILPTREGEIRGKVPGLVMAVDISGSIPSSVANTFLQFCDAVPPDAADTHVLLFNTGIKRLERPYGIQPFNGGGGTDFDCISDYIDREMMNGTWDSYPHVCVFTDGLSRIIPTKNTTPEILSKKWFWFIHPVEHAIVRMLFGGYGYGSTDNPIKISEHYIERILNSTRHPFWMNHAGDHRLTTTFQKRMRFEFIQGERSGTITENDVVNYERTAQSPLPKYSAEDEIPIETRNIFPLAQFVEIDIYESDRQTTFVVTKD